MKSKLFLTFALFLLLGVLPSLAQGPFCPDCTTIQLEHISRADFDLWYANTYLPLSSNLRNRISTAQTKIGSVLSEIPWIKIGYQFQLDTGSMNTVAYGYCMETLTFGVEDPLGQAQSELTLASQSLDYIDNSFNSIVWSNSTFCVTCSATGGGGGECGLCLSCELYLSSCSYFLDSLNTSVDSVKNDINSLKNIMDAWYLKWQAQDDKLQPLIDELKPMLANIKNYYDDYYASDWTSATWNKEKKILDDIVQADLIAKWGRFFGDYASSSFSDLSWSALSGTAVALDYSLNSGQAEGKEGLKWLLYDYNSQKGAPYASFDSLGDVGESDYKHLNWFQKVAVSLGIIAYGVTNNNHTTLDYDSLKNGASDAGASVTSFASTFSGKVGACGNSFKNIFQSFAGIFPADRLPTQIQIHSGMSFSLGQGQDAQVVPPLYWVLSENPALISVLGTLRGFFGVIWWLMGIIVMYMIVMSCASFIGGIVVRVLSVMGSLGKSGAG